GRGGARRPPGRGRGGRGRSAAPRARRARDRVRDAPQRRRPRRGGSAPPPPRPGRRLRDPRAAPRRRRAAAERRRQGRPRARPGARAVSVAERAGTRDEILRVAAELFFAGGYEATTVREIAKELEIKSASIYYHFPDKEQILFEVVRDVLD